jgi:hypothetical protein
LSINLLASSLLFQFFTISNKSIHHSFNLEEKNEVSAKRFFKVLKSVPWASRIPLINQVKRFSKSVFFHSCQ